jgi:deoxyribonuclease IV
MYENLGVHLPISGGIYKVFEYAKMLNINVFQCFTASNRQLSIDKKIDDDRLERFLSEKRKFGKAKIFSHAGYLLNLASEKSDTRKNSVKSLLSEIYRCDQLEIGYVVIHPGSSKDRAEGVSRIVDSLKYIKDKSDSTIKILLEIGPGAGNILPGSLDELYNLYSKLFNVDKNIEIVIDTCHAHAYGYDFSEEHSQSEYWKSINKNIGLEVIGLIHLNDSKAACGKRLDRHENIGRGAIGLDGFKYIMNNSKLKNISKILETPYNELIDYKDELSVLSAL